VLQHRGVLAKALEVAACGKCRAHADFLGTFLSLSLFQLLCTCCSPRAALAGCRDTLFKQVARHSGSVKLIDCLPGGRPGTGSVCCCSGGQVLQAASLRVNGAGCARGSWEPFPILPQAGLAALGSIFSFPLSPVPTGEVRIANLTDLQSRM